MKKERKKEKRRHVHEKMKKGNTHMGFWAPMVLRHHFQLHACAFARLVLSFHSLIN